MDFPVNNGCCQADPFMSRETLDRFDEIKGHKQIQDRKRERWRKKRCTFSTASKKSHELWMRASQQRENLIPDQTALGSPWSCLPPSPLPEFLTLLPSILNFTHEESWNSRLGGYRLGTEYFHLQVSLPLSPCIVLWAIHVDLHLKLTPHLVVYIFSYWTLHDGSIILYMWLLIPSI